MTEEDGVLVALAVHDGDGGAVAEAFLDGGVKAGDACFDDFLDGRVALLGGGRCVSGRESRAQGGLRRRTVGEDLEEPIDGCAGRVVAGDDETENLRTLLVSVLISLSERGLDGLTSSNMAREKYSGALPSFSAASPSRSSIMSTADLAVSVASGWLCFQRLWRICCLTASSLVRIDALSEDRRRIMRHLSAGKGDATISPAASVMRRKDSRTGCSGGESKLTTSSSLMIVFGESFSASTRGGSARSEKASPNAKSSTASSAMLNTSPSASKHRPSARLSFSPQRSIRRSALP